MPALKSDITLIVKANGKTFRIGGVRLIGKRYALKKGRSWVRTIPMATLSRIFDEARRWAVKQEGRNG